MPVVEWPARGFFGPSNWVRNEVGQYESDVDIFRESLAELRVLSSIKQLSSTVCSSGCPRIGRRPAGTEFFRIEHRVNHAIAHVRDFAASPVRLEKTKPHIRFRTTLLTLANVPTLPLPLEQRGNSKICRQSIAPIRSRDPDGS